MQTISPRTYAAYTAQTIDRVPQYRALDAELQRSIQIVSRVLPFRVNNYLIEELIDWSRVPDDPIYRLTFPHRDMLTPAQFDRIAALIDAGPGATGELREYVATVREELNPQPAGQLTLNVPRLDGEPVSGLQHKYHETVLFFPAAGQTCHAYCTFCFRWAQFVGADNQRLRNNDPTMLVRYVQQHPEVSDILFTGGDPLVMSTRVLERYIQPVLDARIEHLRSIRIGSKAPAYWPYRFVTDPDADGLLRLFERIIGTGKHLALMVHFNHYHELDTPIVREAISRIRSTGAQLRMQSPLVRHINDDPVVWQRLWQTGVEMGMVPYYMFVERDTGARNYFAVPLVRAWEIYRQAASKVSGLARTVRGPSMSATPGKIEILGVRTVAGKPVFVLRFLQGRNPEWTYNPFFAEFDPQATWLDDLKPAFGDAAFFYHEEHGRMSPYPRGPF